MAVIQRADSARLDLRARSNKRDAQTNPATCLPGFSRDKVANWRLRGSRQAASNIHSREAEEAPLAASSWRIWAADGGNTRAERCCTKIHIQRGRRAERIKASHDRPNIFAHTFFFHRRLYNPRSYQPAVPTPSFLPLSPSRRARTSAEKRDRWGLK